MTDKRQSDALHLADIADDGAWTFVIGVRKEIAAELRRQHVELETLRTGYAAARLEIESLRAGVPTSQPVAHHQEVYVAHQRIEALIEKESELWRALEVIALGEASDPVIDAGNELVALGYWDADAIRAVKGQAPAQPEAEPATAYAAMPEPFIGVQDRPWGGHAEVIRSAIGEESVVSCFNPDQMRAFADATHALRASRGQAPAGAGMGHTDGGRNMFYEGRFDGESQREQQARLRWANDMRAAFERHTGNGWFDKDWRTETGLWSSAWHACLAAQPTTTAQAAPAYKDSAPELHIGDSAFESWYSTYSPVHKSDKQRARDAYAAGMGDPLVTAAPAAVTGPSEAVAYLDVGAGGYLDLGTDLTDEALSRLPKGRHALIIAGTYGIDGYIAAHTTQPSPAMHGDALDAARYRLVRRGQHWSVIDGIGNALRAEELDAAVDAARAAQEGK